MVMRCSIYPQFVLLFSPLLFLFLQYYTNVYNTPCIAIQNMENWKCTTVSSRDNQSLY